MYMYRTKGINKMDRFIHFISKERANAYKLSDTETPQDVLNRYLLNIELGQAFYPILNELEIALRNRINDIFIADFGVDWIINNNFFDEQLKQTVKELLVRLNKKHKDITNYRLVSELNFGFWSSLFNNNCNVLWQQKNRVSRVFGALKTDIKTINRDLNTIRQFRNRVFHFETLYNHNPKYCHDLMVKYVGSITNKEFINVFGDLDSVDKVLEKLENLKNTRE